MKEDIHVVDLLRGLLQINPELRMSAQEALLHPFFDCVKGFERHNVCIERQNILTSRSIPLFDPGDVDAASDFKRTRIGLYNSAYTSPLFSPLDSNLETSPLFT
jgi:serine/threonine protein kinase